MPTEEEMVNELKIRDKIVKGMKEAERQEQLRKQEELKAYEKKMALRNKKQNGGNKVYRDGETLIGSSVEYISASENQDTILGKKIDFFVPGTNPYYFNINFNNPEFILNRIVDFLNSEFQVNKTKRILINESKLEIKLILIDDEFKKANPDLQLQDLEIKIEIKKSSENDSEKYICELFKNKGDKMEFYDLFDKVSDIFIK
jgi:hypothetical protein